MKADLAAAIEVIQGVLDQANVSVNHEALVQARADLDVRVDDWKLLKMDKFGDLLRYGTFTVLKGDGGKDTEREVCILFDEFRPKIRASLRTLQNRSVSPALDSFSSSGSSNPFASADLPSDDSPFSPAEFTSYLGRQNDSPWSTCSSVSSLNRNLLFAPPEDPVVHQGSDRLPCRQEVSSDYSNSPENFDLDNSPDLPAFRPNIQDSYSTPLRISLGTRLPRTPQTLSFLQTPQPPLGRITGESFESSSAQGLRFKNNLLEMLAPTDRHNSAEEQHYLVRAYLQAPASVGKPLSLTAFGHFFTFNGLFTQQNFFLNSDFSSNPEISSSHRPRSSWNSLTDFEKEHANELALRRPTAEQYHIYLFERILLCCKDINPNKQKSKLIGGKEKIPVSAKGKPRLQLKGRIFMANVTDIICLQKPGRTTARERS